MASVSRNNAREFRSPPPRSHVPSSHFVYSLAKLREIGFKKCAGLSRAVKRKLFSLKIRNKDHVCVNQRIFSIRCHVSTKRKLKYREESTHPRPKILRVLPRCDRHALCPHKVITFGLLNIRSLNSKVDDLLALLRENKIDVIMVVETWHDHDSVSLRRLRSEGLSVVDRPRPRLRDDTLATNHGGLAIVSVAKISLKLLSLNFQPSTFECVCARVSYSSTSCIQVLIYRTGAITAAFFGEISKLLEFFVSFTEPLFVSGDFNVHIEHREDPNACKLRDIFFSHNFECNIDRPTHDLGGTIDLVFFSNMEPAPVVNIEEVGISDHFLLHWKSSLQKPPPTYVQRTFRPWKNLDLIDLRRFLSSTVLCDDRAWHSMNCDELVHQYEEVIMSALDQLIPLRTVKLLPRQSDPWFDEQCKLAKRLLRSIERLTRLSEPTDLVQNLKLWRESKKIYRNLLRTKREHFWRTKVQSESHQPRQLWNSINRLLGRGRAPMGESLSASEFQDYFDKKCSSLLAEAANPPQPSFASAPAHVSFSQFQPVSPSIVAATLRSLPNKQSSQDLLPAQFLKGCLDLLSPFLAEIVNRSFSHGEFPRRLSIACVTPILKKNNLCIDELSSYRPINNLSIISKLIERMCFKQTMAHLNDHNLLPVFQSAYRKHHSTETVILKLTNDFLSAADHGNVTLLASLDLSSAFDLVDHEVLLERLRCSFGFASSVLQWFHSFLTKRSRFFHFRDTYSSVSPVLSGVPQGSVLGPILFVLYTAEIINLVKDFHLSAHVFADDIQVYGSCPCNEVSGLSSRMSSCLSALHVWLKANKLHLNAQKSKVIWLGTKPRLASISQEPLRVDDLTIQPVPSIQCLGFTIDSTLSFSNHVSRTLSSCFGTLRQLRSIRRSITQPLAAYLVTSLVFPRLDYCISCLSGLPDNLCVRLQSIIHASARFVDNLPLSAHISPSLRRLQWPSVKSRRDLRLAVQVFKCMQGSAPSYLSELLCPVSSVSGRSRLRSAHTNALVVPRFRLKMVANKSFSACAPRLWNSLPSSISSLSSLKTFKVAAKDFL